MRINADLTSSTYTGSGIAVFEIEIIKRLSHYSDFSIRGCANFQRGIKRSDFDQFNLPIKYSLIPHKLVYNRECPCGYEKMMGDSELNLFCTYKLPLVNFKSPVIGTIHDLILLKARTESEEKIKRYYDMLKHTAEVANDIIAVSNATKRDIINYLHVPEECITVVYNGVDYHMFNEPITLTEMRKVKEKYNLPERFFLYFGATRNHKNVEGIVKAYALLKPELQKEFKLVITNGKSEIRKLVEELRIQDKVVFTGFIDDDDKVALYQAAYASLFVSFYEGFGIPIIEAQAAGTPVITSNTSSMPEAAGGAALLVDPYCIEEIAYAMEQYAEDQSLYERMKQNGLINAAKFTWESSADKIAQLIRKYK